MAHRRFFVLVAVAALAAGLACGPAAGGGATDSTSFAGQTLRIIVGFTPGGPFDLHARLLAKSLGRHLPGNPGVIIENMPGAGSAIAARHLTGLTGSQGLTIGLLTETSPIDVIDAGTLRDLRLLGSPGPSIQVIAFSERSGIASIDDWRRSPRPVRFAGIAARSVPVVVPLVAGAALGLPVRVIPGYGGSSEMRLALDSGEVDAVCVSLDAFNTVFRSSPGIRIVLRFSTDPVPGFDAPDARSLATDDRSRALLDTGIYLMAPLIRVYVAPRDAPADRLALLRRGLLEAWADPALLAEAAAAGFLIAPVAHDALEHALENMTTRPSILADLRDILRAR